MSELSTIAVISCRESFRRVGFNRECVTMNVACIKDNLFFHTVILQKSTRAIKKLLGFYFKLNEK